MTKQKIQTQITILVLFLLGCQSAVSQPTLKDVLQKGTYQSIEGEFDEFIDGQISNTYKGNFDVVVYEDKGKMYGALLPKFMAEAAYIKKDVEHLDIVKQSFLFWIKVMEQEIVKTT